MIFRRFPTTFRRFPKIFQSCYEGQTNVPKHFLRISNQKFSEDVQWFPENQRPSRKTLLGLKMFWWYTNEFKYNLGDKLDISEVIVSFLSICYHSVYHWFCTRGSQALVMIYNITVVWVKEPANTNYFLYVPKKIWKDISTIDCTE